MHTILRTLILSALLAVLVAACSSGGGATPSAAAPATPAPASEAPASEAPASEAPASEAPTSPAAGGAVTVMVADSDLGQILVDGEGRTLYMFKPDTDGTSTCYDECETNWPPLTVSGDITVGEGLDASLFTTTDRTDGSTQVKAGAWPLYYFANDAAPGDTNGQDVGDVWYVVSPTGEPIES
jgi:predicted lipoprotein with Yx(FWY)xxD motif